MVSPREQVPVDREASDEDEVDAGKETMADVGRQEKVLMTDSLLPL